MSLNINPGHNSACLTEYDEEAAKRVFREDGYLDGVEDGKAAGMQQKAVEDAQRMIVNGKLSKEEIADISGLPIETVQQLAEELATVKA